MKRPCRRILRAIALGLVMTLVSVLVPAIFADDFCFVFTTDRSWPRPTTPNLGNLLPPVVSERGGCVRLYARTSSSEHVFRAFGVGKTVRTYRTPEAQDRWDSYCEMIRTIRVQATILPGSNPWISTPDGLRPSCVDVHVWTYGWPARCAYREHYEPESFPHEPLIEDGRPRDQVYAEYTAAVRVATGYRQGISLGQPSYRAPSSVLSSSGELVLPTAPLWAGLVVNVAFYSSLWYAPGAAWRGVRRWRRIRRNGCAACGYELGELVTCPECSEPAQAASASIRS